MVKKAVLLLLTIYTFTAQGRNTGNLGLPFTKQFKSSDYGASHQNWAIAQGQNGYMYFGNNDGLLEFNGQEWKIYSMPNNSAVRYIHVSTDDKIYVGAFNEFGYFERDEYGSLIYTSLSNEIKETDIKTVWKIIPYEDAIYFIAERQNIFKYDFIKVSKIYIPSVVSEFRAFLVNNVFYIFDSYAGLAVLKNDTVYRYQNEIFDKKIAVYSILPIEDDYILIGTNTNGFFKVDTKKLSPIPNEQTINLDKTKRIVINSKTSLKGILFYEEFKSAVSEEIKKGRIYYGIKNDNDEFVYATLKGGIFILNKKGDLIDRYFANKGIPDNNVFCVYEDMEYNLWATTEKGITLLEPYSGYRIFDTHSAIKGNILSLSSINSNIYIGTTSGLYAIEREQDAVISLPSRYNTITDDYIYIMSFLKNPSDNQSFLFSSLSNIHEYNIQTKELKNIHSVYAGQNMISYPLDSSAIFIGHRPGITVIKRENNKKYKVIETFEGFTEHVGNMTFDKVGNLYISNISGLLMMKFNSPNNFKDYSIVRYNTTNGLPTDEKNQWLIIGDSIVVLTTNGIYLPDKQENIGKTDLTFKEYSELNQQFDKEDLPIRQILEAKTGDWLIRSDNEVSYFLTEQKRLVRQPFLRDGDLKISDMCIGDNQRVWMSSYDNLYCFDFKTMKSISHKQKLSFTNITIGQDSTIPIRINNNVKDIGDVSFKYNSLKVEVTYPSYRDLKNIKYSFFLDGIDKSWTPWANIGRYAISYLPVGQYTLHAKALDSDGNETNEIQLIFSIKPPFYRTITAFIIYTIVVIALVYGLIKLNTLRLKRERQKLRDTIKKAISTVEKQKDELIEQAKELETTNLELDKLSLVARYTDNAVAIMDSKGNFEWINEGFTRIYGYELEELLDRTLDIKIEKNFTHNINKLLETWYHDQKPIVYESLNMHKNGSEIWVQTTLTPILNENNEVTKLVAIDANISKLKKAEEEIKLQTDEVQIQRDIAILQRDEILRQKDEITDSILYAERIQEAILHTNTHLNKLYRDSFVLSIPRNIVSGDFFWCHANENHKVIAVADCTGHGVPGAFMSLIGISFLKEIVSTLGFYKPDEILKMLRYNIIYALNQKCDDGSNGYSGSFSESKDSMDMSLVTVDIQNNILYYAGANCPIYIINENQITEYKPDKMPIGMHRNNHLHFTLHTIPIKKGDRIYMFTNGLIDQFGGKDGKKLKRNGFKEKIVELQEFDFNEQCSRLKNFYKMWSAGIEQVDDILIVGFDTDSGT